MSVQSGFEPIHKLCVSRTLSTGRQVEVGTLVQNQHAVYFQYADEYLNHFSNLSPFGLEWTNTLQKAPKHLHRGLHGAFADALPDGWGMLLMDRVFRQNTISPSSVSTMDRLAFVGHSALGALTFSPVSPYATNTSQTPLIDLHEMGMQAQAIFEGQTEEVLASLVAAGSSGGARPKAQIYFSKDKPSICHSQPQSDDEAWLVKFTSSQLTLGHEEGLCEAVYLTLAKNAGIAVSQWLLLDAPKPSGAQYWLALKRFDWVKQNNGSGRLSMHSTCGLLDADYQSPSLDYETLIKATGILCKSPQAAQSQFKRALFNLFAANQDDHSKNWAFLLDDDSNWSHSPFYDVTFSPTPFGEHATSFAGYGKAPNKQAIQHLAHLANFNDWKQAQAVIDEVVCAISQFSAVAKQHGIKASTIKLIEKHLNDIYQQNKRLLDVS